MGRPRLVGVPADRFKRALIPNRLYDWIKANNYNNDDFSRRIGVGRRVVDLVSTSRMLPSLITAFDIEEVTNGEVPATYWLSTRLAIGYREGQKDRIAARAGLPVRTHTPFPSERGIQLFTHKVRVPQGWILGADKRLYRVVPDSARDPDPLTPEDEETIKRWKEVRNRTPRTAANLIKANAVKARNVAARRAAREAERKRAEAARSAAIAREQKATARRIESARRKIRLKNGNGGFVP